MRVCLQQWALLAALGHRHDMAARLMGFVEAGFAAAGETREPTEQTLCDRLQGLQATSLPQEEIDSLAAAGARLSEREAVVLVLETLAPA